MALKTQKEGNLSRLITMRASAIGHRLLLNPTGVGWVGKIKQKFRNGDVLLEAPRCVTFGCGGNGASDTHGIKTVVITPDMVGTTIGQWVSVEVKKPNEEPRQDQIDWIEFVRSRGGLAGVARCEDDVNRILAGELLM